jgi:hypothetical protein
MYISIFLSSYIISLSNPFVVKSLHYQIPLFVSKITSVLSRVNTGDTSMFFKFFDWFIPLSNPFTIKSPYLLKKYIRTFTGEHILLLSMLKQHGGMYSGRSQVQWFMYGRTQIFTDMVGVHGWVRVNKNTFVLNFWVNTFMFNQ